MTVPDGHLRLQLLSMNHTAALQAFERANRAFFAARIGDRGDDFFTHFERHLAERVAENETGRSLLYVAVDPSGQIVARINLTDIDRPELTELGYRVAESAQGRGVATWGVAATLALAADRGVRKVSARVATTNTASRRVLERCGFSQFGPADPPPGSASSFLGYCRKL